jgi:orotate phosphoribosyltransferase
VVGAAGASAALATAVALETGLALVLTSGTDATLLTGELHAGEPVVIVVAAIHTGETALRLVRAVQEREAGIAAVLAVLDHGTGGAARLAAMSCSPVSLFTAAELSTAARREARR